ncbi:hybrid sensor histidine kinase/response regulator [Leptospira selangorensis]|uniref:histidine kinase n=1 Tax=Leptospira selangorensis TaxID=2484982 RepID=A0A4R9FTA6_9LEPT|nr:ATP-binding protein [Leptospira selangorensis]TGK02058.1 hybrid sensor histidine kinase/response regulator [Leptospira selangorensis]TGM11559.1 hybrid sensor histidine kinase/response regulator [Leptospira selangorensis]TGM21208.1 hybrid sensor histidine kinase/response regulator [Leptospira selangorensis]
MNTRPKILIVDDRPENLVALETVLKDLDVELIRALSGNEALKATLHNDFALALLDIQMPEMDGYELASILREEEKTARLPFIFISAVYTDNLNVFKGYERGAFSFITKPFEPQILRNKVKFFVDKHLQEISLHILNEDLKKKNDELENANKELDAFCYSVSHDLRGPLRAIEGFAKILHEDHIKDLNEDAKHLLDVIVGSTQKMDQLIDSLLLLSRTGKKEITKTIVNISELVQHTLYELQSHAQNGKTKILVGELSPALGDVSLLSQVFVNLISNAIKYSSKKEEPIVEIGCNQSNGENVYFVKDNGAGFNMKYQNRLFGVFQRLHDNRDFEGIGIGLAIVHRIITRHGGKVWAEGEVGKGATFYITLPQIQEI